MATVSTQLFFRGNRTYGVGSISFDLIISEQHNFNNQLSDHNVEDGSVISDHIKNELENGTLVGLISNFSIKAYTATGVRVSNRAQTAFDELVKLWESKTLVTIVTVMRVYENVSIVSCSISRSATTGEAIELNISFKKIRVVKLQQIQATTVIGLPPPIKVPDTSSNQNRQVTPKLDFSRQQGTIPDSNSQLMNNITVHTN